MADTPTTQPAATTTPTAQPQVLPDVATKAHPSGAATDPLSPKAETEQERLQNALPAINKAAQKVGGFRQLADIAKELEQQGK
jgi:hypothetical protein